MPAVLESLSELEVLAELEVDGWIVSAEEEDEEAVVMGQKKTTALTLI